MAKLPSKSKVLYFSSLSLLVLIFIWQSIASMEKYMEKSTGFHVLERVNTCYAKFLTVSFSFQAMDSILYPSITVCYKSSLEIDLFDKMMNSTKPDHDISEFVQETLKNHLWELEDEIYFFTQPGVMNLTFPCTTTLGTTCLRR